MLWDRKHLRRDSQRPRSVGYAAATLHALAVALFLASAVAGMSTIHGCGKQEITPAGDNKNPTVLEPPAAQSKIPQGLTLTAQKDTWIKTSSKQSSELQNYEKCFVEGGSTLIVTQVSGPSDGHQRIGQLLSFMNKSRKALQCSLSSLWIFGPDFSQSSAGLDELVPGYVWPTVGRKIRSDSCGDGYFGSPRSWGGKHEGLDIMAAVGEPIVATDSGSLISASIKGAYGNTIDIKHAGSRMSRYAHLDSYVIRSSGAYVKKGTKIAIAGKSGNASASCVLAHLHFEILENNALKDPLKLLP